MRGLVAGLVLLATTSGPPSWTRMNWRVNVDSNAWCGGKVLFGCAIHQTNIGDDATDLEMPKGTPWKCRVKAMRKIDIDWMRVSPWADRTVECSGDSWKTTVSSGGGFSIQGDDPPGTTYASLSLDSAGKGEPNVIVHMEPYLPK